MCRENKGREKLKIDFRKLIVFYIYEILAYKYGFEKPIINTILKIIIMVYYFFILDRELKNKIVYKIFEEIFYILIFIGLIFIIIFQDIH